MPAVDRVDGVVDGAVHHRQVRHRHLRWLCRGADQRVRRVQVPLRDGVRASGRGNGEQRRNRRQQASDAPLSRGHLYHPLRRSRHAGPWACAC